MANALVWFRNDLRLDDQPALRAALDDGHVPICIHIHAPDEEGGWAPGAASNAWRRRSLAALDADLRVRGSRLRLFAGPSLETLLILAASFDAEAVYWNRRYEPLIERRDAGIKAALRDAGLQARSFNGALLFEPWELRTGQSAPYRVFTPFWRKALSEWRLPAPWTAPDAIAGTDEGPAGVALDALRLAPSAGWDTALLADWQPGEAGARAALEVFMDGALRGYSVDRDRPDRTGTSRLSPHLHFGEIAPWRVAAALAAERRAATGDDVDAFVRQLGWREFAYHLMHHFPASTDADFNPRFAEFEWARAPQAQLKAWRRGRTGVPIVDAGLRELWGHGWMHNRVRMLVASFLCKHVRVHWLEGARWFWDTLVDADLACNTLGWQWVAGTGADAAPYFRVFNPVTQAAKVDPDGDYVARWVPELAALAMPARHAPWSKPALLREVAPRYPRQPLVDLQSGREAALSAYRAARRVRGTASAG